MALATPILQQKILEALEASSKISVDTDSSSDNSNQSDKARKDTAEALAKAIEAFVKSGGNHYSNNNWERVGTKRNRNREYFIVHYNQS